jgi:CRISPR-associated protein Csb1
MSANPRPIMTYDQLLQAVQSSAGLRLRARLQPLYGTGEIVFPCTVAGGKYQTFNRRLPEYKTYEFTEINEGQERRLPVGAVPCVIIDSVQSQANRMEKALLEDIRAGNIHLPHIETDFTGVEGLEKEVGTLTCFDCPHRAFDAILRDSVDASGRPFPETDAGQRIVRANSANASALFQVSPASLLFGSWDSTGLSGGLGEKFTRCVVSELVGVNAIEGERGGFRVDPLNSSSVVDCKKIADDENFEIWRNRQGQSKKDKAKASVVNHGNIVIDRVHGGVTVDYIQQSTTISFAALRQLHFPVGGKDCSGPALTVLAAMALHAAALNMERGWHLRSRCDLVLDEGSEIVWEILGGAASVKQALPATSTRELLSAAIDAAKKAGLPWNTEPLRLVPSSSLRKLVIASQKAQRESATAE